MARLRKKAELWSHLTQVGVFRETTGTHGDTTLTAAAAAGDTTLTVTAITNFADGDYVRIGSGEEMEIGRVSGAPAGSTITLRWALAFAHANGDIVEEQSQTHFGHITDDGVRLSLSGTNTAVNSAIRRLVLGYLIAHVEIMAEWSVEGFNLENFATALGILETKITGSGTAAAPSRLVLDPANFREENDLAFYFLGSRKDGTIVEGHLWGVELDFNALNTQMRRGEIAAVPFQARATSGAVLLTYV